MYSRAQVSTNSPDNLMACSQSITSEGPICDKSASSRRVSIDRPPFPPAPCETTPKLQPLMKSHLRCASVGQLARVQRPEPSEIHYQTLPTSLLCSSQSGNDESNVINVCAAF